MANDLPCRLAPPHVSHSQPCSTLATLPSLAPLAPHVSSPGSHVQLPCPIAGHANPLPPPPPLTCTPLSLLFLVLFLFLFSVFAAVWLPRGSRFLLVRLVYTLPGSIWTRQKKKKIRLMLWVLCLLNNVATRCTTTVVVGALCRALHGCGDFPPAVTRVVT